LKIAMSKAGDAASDANKADDKWTTPCLGRAS
jgi:hypothetical protein